MKFKHLKLQPRYDLNIILNYWNQMKIWQKYIYKWRTLHYRYWKRIFRFPSSKTIGIDKVPGEWIKIRNNQAELKINELKIHKWYKIFRNWIEKGTIPDFWMNWRLILVSKEKNKVPKIENTRPISILLSITKVFEVVIFGNLEDIAYQQGYISRNQRGFTQKNEYN